MIVYLVQYGADSKIVYTISEARLLAGKHGRILRCVKNKDVFMITKRVF